MARLPRATKTRNLVGELLSVASDEDCQRIEQAARVTAVSAIVQDITDRKTAKNSLLR